MKQIINFITSVILLILFFQYPAACQSPKLDTANYNYYYEKEHGDRKFILYKTDNWKTYFIGIQENNKRTLDTLYYTTTNHAKASDYFRILDSHFTEDRGLFINYYFHIITMNWVTKKQGKWVPGNSGTLALLLSQKVTEVKLLDIEHIRVVADGKTTIYTIDYEKNTYSSDDEKK